MDLRVVLNKEGKKKWGFKYKTFNDLTEDDVKVNTFSSTLRIYEGINYYTEFKIYEVERIEYLLF